MIDLTDWQASNDAYLAAAVQWVRLQLEGLAARSASKRSRGKSRPGDALKKAAAAMEAAEHADFPPALVLLSRRFGLSRFEQAIVLLCASVEFDTRIAALCARAQDDPNRPYPTFALALALFDAPSWDALSPDRPLRYWRFVDINRSGAQPLITSALRIDERIANYVKGLNYLDPRLDVLLSPLAVTPAELPPSQQAAAGTVVRYLEHPLRRDALPVIQLIGPDALSKQLVVAQVAAALELSVYRLPLEGLPAALEDQETLARLWQREVTLMPAALYLDAHAVAPGDEGGEVTPRLKRFLDRSGGLVFLDVRDAQVDLNRPTLMLDIAKPTASEQRAAWDSALDDDSSGQAAQLASQFNLNVPTITEIAHTARAMPDTPDPVWRACLAHTRPRLDLLAQRIDARATWDDIVLPEEQERLLHQITNQVRQRSTVYEQWGFGRRMNRGKGIGALFAGESGTGKTMAAEVIANALQLDLYRIDLSAVVSKYIGETEKNLRRLFDAAEDGGAILFFDEADALFGKRSEVKDSHDRYANIEINYLLQRMEAYHGLAILATNMKAALDQAFMRRLRFVVKFPFPGQEQRRAIWQKSIPPELPTGALDFDFLARLNLAGGNIHNIVLNAAFLAAELNSAVTMPLLLEAARTEFRKLERPANDAQFHWSPNGVVG